MASSSTAIGLQIGLGWLLLQTPYETQTLAGITMFGLGIWELLIILAIVVLLFGSKRLPMIGEGLGSMITNFKSARSKDAEGKPAEDATVIEPEQKQAS